MLDWNGLIDERTRISDLLMVPNLKVRGNTDILSGMGMMGTID